VATRRDCRPRTCFGPALGGSKEPSQLGATTAPGTDAVRHGYGMAAAATTTPGIPTSPGPATADRCLRRIGICADASAADDLSTAHVPGVVVVCGMLTSTVTFLLSRKLFVPSISAKVMVGCDRLCIYNICLVSSFAVSCDDSLNDSLPVVVVYCVIGHVSCAIIG
jgi:hypothetical protein